VCTSDNDCPGVVPFSCAARRCVAAGGSVATALPCNGLVSLCPGTSSCLPIGRCAQSGLACAMGSRACPGGPGDTCEIGVRTCWQLVVDYGCDAAIYQNPRVGIADLPAAAPRLRGALDQVQPDGNTPVVPAVRGALAHMRAHQSAHPERRAALVLATDGLPEGCDTRPQSVAQVTEALAGARQATPSLPTYVIGVFAPDMLATSQPALAEMATAGGTGAPFILDPNQNLAARFLQALNQIRGAALACEFQIPRPASGAQDYGKVNVRFTRAPGAPPEDLVYVTSPDRCDPARGGWYYDVPPALGTPTRIIVCDSTCRRFQAEAMGQVEIRIGCTTRID
jgi:hypothetical protein